jgi:hypothetical protein
MIRLRALDCASSSQKTDAHTGAGVTTPDPIPEVRPP